MEKEVCLKGSSDQRLLISESSHPVIPFTTNWKSDNLFCQERNMHCRLMAGFVLMLWVFSLLAFIVTHVRQLPSEVYMSVAQD